MTEITKLLLKEGEMSLKVERMALSDDVKVLVNGKDLISLKPIGRTDGEEMRKKSIDINGYVVRGVPSFWWPDHGKGIMELWPAAGKFFEILVKENKNEVSGEPSSR